MGVGIHLSPPFANSITHLRNFFEMILCSGYCILYSDEGKPEGAAAVAQLVEHGKTGLDKGLNSNQNTCQVRCRGFESRLGRRLSVFPESEKEEG